MPTMREALAEFQRDNHAAMLSEATIKQYNSLLNRFARHIGDARLVQTIT